MHLGLRFRQSVLVFAFSVVSGLLALRSQAADSPLLGTWEWDHDKALQEFKVPTQGSEQLKTDAARAKRFVEGTVKQLGSNMTLTYTDKEYIEVTVGGKGAVLSKTSSPYRIVEIGKDYVIIDQQKNGGTVKLFVNGNSFYVEVKVGEFTYRDYFTKM
jgi:hypothetical protein